MIGDYIGNLENISARHDWDSWVEFFVRAITEQSKISMQKLRDLHRIQHETKTKIIELKTTFAIQIVDFLFEKIKFNTSYFIKKTGINGSTARALLKELVDKDIISIEKSGSGTKSNIYKFDALYEMIKQIEAQ